MKNLLIVAVVVLFGLAAPARAQLTIDELVSQSNLREGSVALRDIPSWDSSREIIVRDSGVHLGGLQARFPDANITVVTSFEQALSKAENAGAIIGFCDDELLAAATALTWIQIYSSGAERCLDSPKLASGEVILTNMQKISSPMIAEHAVAMMLSLTRNLPRFARAMDEGGWSRGPALTGGMASVSGKTLLVLGLGGIGTEVARLGDALGMRVLGMRNSSREGPPFVDYVGLSGEMLDLAAKADVIVNALPLTAKTRGLIDARFFAAARRGSYFINVGRGGTVATDDLLAALENRQIAGAGLDVTDPEPLPSGHPLWAMNNVIITPHVAGRGNDRQRQMLVTVDNIRRYIAGDALLNVVDPARGY